MHQRDHAVDIGKIAQVIAAKGVGDVAGHGRRTVHAGQHADIVARANAAIGALVALETRRRRDEFGIVRLRAIGVVALEVPYRDIVNMDVGTGGDVLGREADNLTVFAHRGTGGAVCCAAPAGGGAVRGGRVFADWPGLAERDLYEGRDLKPTTDMRAVFKGVLMMAM